MENLGVSLRDSKEMDMDEAWLEIESMEILDAQIMEPYEAERM